MAGHRSFSLGASCCALLRVLILISSIVAPCAVVAETSAAGEHISVTTDSIAIELTFDASRLAVGDSGDYAVVMLDDGVCELWGEPGQPLLPVRHLQVLVPSTAQYEGLDKVATVQTELEGAYALMPASYPVPLSKPLPSATAKPDPDIYSLDSLWPAEPVQYLGATDIRGMRILSFRVYPMQYNPAQGKLWLSGDMRITVALSQGPSLAAAAPATQEFAIMVGKLVDNPQTLDGLYGDARLDSHLLQGDAEYLIITNSTLSWTFQDLADWKESRGMTAVVVTTETIQSDYTGVDDQERIKRCIKDYAQNHGTLWVLLGGDDSIVADRDCYAYVSSSDGPVTDNTIPTDAYYAGLDDMDWNDDGDSNPCEVFGDSIDLGPDVFVGRAPVRTISGAEAFVDKVIAYENDALTFDHAEQMILMGCELWNTWEGRSDADWRSEAMYDDCIDPYWDPVRVRLYDTNTDFGGSSYELTDDHVVDQISTGYNFCFMATHGSPTSWGMETGGSFGTPDATACSNSAEQGNIYTMACSTSAFDDGRANPVDVCLGEAFIRNPSGGAVSYIGSTRYGWGNGNPELSYGRSMAYARQFYTQLFSGAPTAGDDGADPSDWPYRLGAVYTGHKLAYAGSSSWAGAYRWLQFSINLFGDPAMVVRTENVTCPAPVLTSPASGYTTTNSTLTLEWAHPGDCASQWGFMFRIGTSPDGDDVTNGPQAETPPHTDWTVDEPYYYRDLYWSARSDSTDGTWAASRMFRIEPPGTIPPANLRATEIRSSRITLAWDDQTPDEQGYRLYQWDAVEGEYDCIRSNLPADSTEYTVTHLDCGQTYRFKLVAYGPQGDSLGSPELSVDTVRCCPDGSCADLSEPNDAPDEADKLSTESHYARARCFGAEDDEDWFWFYALSGQTYDIVVDSVGSSCDPVLQLWDSDGETLRLDADSYADGTGETIVYQSPSTGYRFVSVREYWNRCGPGTEFDVHVSEQPSTVQTPLDQGWNLVSMQVIPDDTAPWSVFNSVIGCLDVVWIRRPVVGGYTWYHYRPDPPYYVNRVTGIQPTDGLYVHMSCAGTWTVSGIHDSDWWAQNREGWALIGQPLSEACEPMDLFINRYSSGSAVERVLGQDPSDPDEWLEFSNDAVDNDTLELLVPNTGYWAELGRDSTWVGPGYYPPPGTGW